VTEDDDASWKTTAVHGKGLWKMIALVVVVDWTMSAIQTVLLPPAVS
jgi:hypothetical protein